MPGYDENDMGLTRAIKEKSVTVYVKLIDTLELNMKCTFIVIYRE